MRFSGLLLTVLGLCAAGTTEAQIAPYQVLQDVVPYVGLSASAVEFTPGLGDATTRAVTLPFEVTLFGERFSTININANGLVSVSSGGSGLNFPPFTVPSTRGANGFVAALWGDWCSSVNGCAGATNPGVGVFYEIDARPGQGRVSIEWRRIRHFSDTQRPSDVNFKLTWYEGASSQLELHYGSTTPGIDFVGQSTRMEGRIGLENADGTEGMWLAPCAGNGPCTTSDIQNLANTRITILADAGEDVTVSPVTVAAVGYPGLPLQVSTRLVSRHQNPLGPFTWAAHLLSAAGTSTVGSAAVFTSAPVTLNGFESRPLDFDLEVPADLPPGNYRLAIVADAGDAIAETVEANNVGLSGTVHIAERAPDFHMTSLQPAQQDLRPGDLLEIDYTVENQGNEPGLLNMQVYLSSNRAITTSDIRLGSALSVMTVSREVVSGRLREPLPTDLQTGLYYVGALLDEALAIPELDETNNTGRAPRPLIIHSNRAEIVTESLPTAVLGRPYSVALQSAGGDGRFEYEVTEGFMPRGLSFDSSTGLLYGVPLRAISVDIGFRVRSGVATASKTLTLVVIEPELPLTLVTQALPDATLGQDYAMRLYAAGGVLAYGWSVLQGSLPPGLAMSADGDVFGAPTRAGSYPVSFLVRDNAGAQVSRALSLTVRSPPNLSIVTRDLPGATLGGSYFQTLHASGGIAPLTWRRITVPPPGLIVTTEGLVQGSPEQLGAYRFLVEVTDAVGNIDSNALTVRVEDEGRFSITTEALVPGIPGITYREVVRASGGEPPYVWELARGEGRLPAGFKLEPGAGVMDGETADNLIISGRLEREGQWAFTVRVFDRRGRSHARAFAVVSRVPPIEPAPIEATGCNCFDGIPRNSEGGLGLWAGGLLFLAFIRRTAGRIRRK